MKCKKIKAQAMTLLNWSYSIKICLFIIFSLCLNNGRAQDFDTIEISIQKNIHLKSNPVIIIKNDSGITKINSIFKGKDTQNSTYFFVVNRDTNTLKNLDSIYSKEKDRNWLLLPKYFKKNYFSFVGLQFICVTRNNTKLSIKKRKGININKKIMLCFRCSHSCLFPTRRRP